MSKRWQYCLVAVLALCSAGLCWAGLTVHQTWLGLMFLTLAIMLWVPMALLVP